MLKHVPGGIISRSFSQWSLNSYAKFTEFVSPNNAWGDAAKAFLQEPTSLTQNPYVASEAQVKGISLYTGFIRTTINSFEAPVYLKPGDNPYTPGQSTNFSLSTDARDTNGNSASVSERPRYSDNRGISFSSQVGSSRPGSSTVALSPSAESQSSAAVTTSFASNTVPSEGITVDSVVTLEPSCIDAPFFNPGTIQCPVGFQVVLNGGGDEAGCIPTDLWEFQQNNVISNLDPQTLLVPRRTNPEDRDWFVNVPLKALTVETQADLKLCQGAYLPVGDA